MSESETKSSGTLGDMFSDKFRLIKDRMAPAQSDETQVTALSEEELEAAEPQMPETEEVREPPDADARATLEEHKQAIISATPVPEERRLHAPLFPQKEVSTGSPVGEEFPNGEPDVVSGSDERGDYIDVTVPDPKWETYSGVPIPEPEDVVGFTMFLNAVPHDTFALCRAIDVPPQLMRAWKSGAIAPKTTMREAVIEWLVNIDCPPDAVDPEDTGLPGEGSGHQIDEEMIADHNKAKGTQYDPETERQLHAEYEERGLPPAPTEWSNGGIDATELKRPLSDAERDPEREARLTKLLEYADPSRRDALIARYVGYSRFDLEQMLNIFEQVLGSAGADEQLQAINKSYLECLADPRHRAAQLYLESKGVKFNKLASDISRVIGDDVIVNNLKHNEYLDTARAAFNDLAVLKEMVLAIEPHLDFFHSAGKNDEMPEGMAVPASMKHLIGILRHTWAHLRASVSHAKADEEILKRTSDRLCEVETKHAHVRDRLETADARLSRRYRDMDDGITLVYSRATDCFLAHRSLANGRNTNGIRLPLTGFHWTEKHVGALVFETRVKARKAVDEIVLKSRIITRPGRPATLAGQALDQLDFATAALRVPVRD